MLRAAILGAQFAGQLSKRGLENVDVVWLGTAPDRFEAEVPALEPQILIIDLSEFEADANERIKVLLERCRAELNIVTYSFARRALLRSLQSQQVRVLQSPITLEVLQAHLAPFVIRNVLQTARKEIQMEQLPRPRFTREQLGKLMEVTTTVQCECPNHVAQVVERLQAFEAYSKQCENKNDADRTIHALLYRASAGARLEMEKALEALLKHENLTVDS